MREELTRMGGWKNNDLHATLEDLTHLSDALADLRVRLGLQSDSDNPMHNNTLDRSGDRPAL
jgi:hypothetical protein